MEPRLRSRGSLTVSFTITRRSGLQWSRGCEAAEATTGAVERTYQAGLQWSRGCEAAEACAASSPSPV